MSHLGFTDPGQAAAPSSGEVSEALSFQSLVLPASLKSSCPQFCLTALVGDSEAFSVSPSSRSGLWRWGRPGWGARSPQSWNRYGPGESCGIGLLFSSTSRGPGTPPHIFSKTLAPTGARALCSSPHSHSRPQPKLPSFSTPQDDVPPLATWKPH